MDDDHSRTRKKLYEYKRCRYKNCNFRRRSPCGGRAAWLLCWRSGLHLHDDSGSAGSGNYGPFGSPAPGSCFSVSRMGSETSHSHASSPLSKRKLGMSTLLEAPGDQAGFAPAGNQTNPTSHILVVDDDGEIRALSAEALVGFGYR